MQSVSDCGNEQRFWRLLFDVFLCYIFVQLNQKLSNTKIVPEPVPKTGSFRTATITYISFYSLKKLLWALSLIHSKDKNQTFTGNSTMLTRDSTSYWRFWPVSLYYVKSELKHCETLRFCLFCSSKCQIKPQTQSLASFSLANL